MATGTTQGEFALSLQSRYLLKSFASGTCVEWQSLWKRENSIGRRICSSWSVRCLSSFGFSISIQQGMYLTPCGAWTSRMESSGQLHFRVIKEGNNMYKLNCRHFINIQLINYSNQQQKQRCVFLYIVIIARIEQNAAVCMGRRVVGIL